MSRYIDAINFFKKAQEVAYPIVHGWNDHEKGLTLMGIAQLLDEQPTADVRENVRSEKEICDVTGTTFWYQCSACKKPVDLGDCFCKHCGADMRGEDNAE